MPSVWLPAEVMPCPPRSFPAASSSEAVPAPPRCVPSGLRFPHRSSLIPNICRTPLLRSFFCSERPSLYYSLSFFLTLKKKRIFHTLFIALDSYKVECKLLCEGAVFLVPGRVSEEFSSRVRWRWSMLCGGS